METLDGEDNKIMTQKINDTYTAGREWLKRQLEIEEFDLPDYERPLKNFDTKHVGPFKSKVARYGFAGACFRVVAP